MTFCVSTDVGTWTNWLTFETDPDHNPDAGTGFLCPIAYVLQRGNVEFYYVGKIPCTGIGRPSKQRRVVLRRRNTVVGGKCALPNALIVSLSAAEKSLISPSRQHWTELIPKSSLSKRNAFPHFIRIIAETWRDGAGGLRGRRRRRPVVYSYICALSPR